MKKELAIEMLRELSKFVTNSRLKKIDMLTPKMRSEDSAYFKATSLMATDKLKTDMQLADMLGVGKASSSLRVFKLRLGNKLLNNFLFLDVDKPGTYPYTKAQYMCSRNQHCIRMLLVMNKRNAAVRLAEQTLKKATEFELVEVALYCARVLRTHYSLLGDRPKFDIYAETMQKYRDLYFAEDKAAQIKEDVATSLVNTSTANPQQIKEAREKLAVVEQLFQQYDTYQLGLSYFRLRGTAEFISGDYAAAVANWQAFDRHIDKYRQYEYEGRTAESELNKLDCYMHMRAYEQGRVCAERCNELYQKNSNNWFISREYLFLLAMHTRNYIEAGAILDNIVQNSDFKKQPANRQEKWKIFGAYYYLVVRAGLAGDAGLSEGKFRLSSFMNDTLIYSKDKRGYNMAILIVQIMGLLLEKDFVTMIDKMNAWERYAYRYFKGDAEYRGQVFLKMIAGANRCSYDRKKTEEHTRALHQSLKDMQFRYVSNLEGLEVVPFTELWDIVLAKL